MLPNNLTEMTAGCSEEVKNPQNSTRWQGWSTGVTFWWAVTDWAELCGGVQQKQVAALATEPQSTHIANPVLVPYSIPTDG